MIKHQECQEKEVPVWDSFFKWLETIDPLEGSNLEKALNYALNHKETLCNYLLDGRCEITMPLNVV